MPPFHLLSSSFVLPLSSALLSFSLPLPFVSSLRTCDQAHHAFAFALRLSFPSLRCALAFPKLLLLWSFKFVRRSSSFGEMVDIGYFDLMVTFKRSVSQGRRMIVYVSSALMGSFCFLHLCIK
jgi:hypothetical protein